MLRFGIDELETVKTTAATYACTECPLCCLLGGKYCNPV